MAPALRGSWLGGLLLAALAAAGLGASNPSPAAYERFAATHLVDELDRLLCEGDALPPLLRLAVPNCSELVQAQNVALGALVSRQTRRWNLGLLSVYRSDVGGQQVLIWQVPRFRATVLGVAGRFVIVQASLDDEQP
ncbi:DUF4359 domain-containing protein [Cyanobium sp. ATX 6A2]|uniref:DUF4359 domain-containing protein n=1 Tax=Cyanobium sp. ATX 6A2 TaxID=2823700 RepID=UPI0020CCF96F|nr:DUF4359 domain-containing protein [Cyanobium sp. ATX 6A2]MCP9886637.1 DUF4359 domain-containing protein [Cyanobium sp. ATX 6A2]